MQTWNKLFAAAFGPGTAGFQVQAFAFAATQTKPDQTGIQASGGIAFCGAMSSGSEAVTTAGGGNQPGSGQPSN